MWYNGLRRGRLRPYIAKYLTIEGESKMDYSEDYERYLEEQLLLCQRYYAFCQEIASQATSEMTELEQKEQKLGSDLARLREAREIYCHKQVSQLTVERYYTPNRSHLQEEIFFDSASPDQQSYQRGRRIKAAQKALWPEHQ
jgi:hypothetical protein